MSMLSIAGNKLSLSGTVDFKAATSLEAKGIAFITHTSEKSLIADLSEITEGDSAALALMLSWRRQADKMEIHLVFVGWSEALLRLATLCGVDQVLTST